MGSTSSAGLSIGRLGQAPRGLDRLDLNRFSGYKFPSASAKGTSVDFLHTGPEMSLNRHCLQGFNLLSHPTRSLHLSCIESLKFRSQSVRTAANSMECISVPPYHKIAYGTYTT
ncbi:hypothetical protein TNCV_2462881 [Trichonephila clavipes]|nr:hypothetical protein TNCV_2462881 [Trichonephila clavipes]